MRPDTVNTKADLMSDGFGNQQVDSFPMKKTGCNGTLSILSDISTDLQPHGLNTVVTAVLGALSIFGHFGHFGHRHAV